MTLTTADIEWKDGRTPVSKKFGDVYYSAQDGLEETRYVFLRGNGLPDAWFGRDLFVVGETGFGTGLNFLATWDAWRRSRPSSGRLHFVSVEGFPLSRIDLISALAPWTELDDLSDQLIRLYPEPHPGFHRIDFPDGVTLTLLIGEATEMLSELEGQFDAWFLDGFAPAQNPEMWRPDIFDNIARLSRIGATVSTFTVAGEVRRQLARIGFQVSKTPGFGRKREMCEGRFKGPKVNSQRAPWYASPEPHEGEKKALIIGGGIAGASAASSLKRRGWQVGLVERHDELAREASGNPEAMLMPRFSVDDTPEGRFYVEAYRYTLQELVRLKAQGADIDLGFCGVLKFAKDAKEQRRLELLHDKGLLPETMIEKVSAREATKLSGVKIDASAFHFPQGGWASPRALCQALVQGCDLHTSEHIESIDYSGGNWRLKDDHGVVRYEAPVLILANGIEASTIPQLSWLPLLAFRGQISVLPETNESKNLKTVLSFGKYVIPGRNGHHSIGATYDKMPSRNARPRQSIRKGDHQKNIEGVQEFLPEIFEGVDEDRIKGRAALRCTTPDRHPVIGPVPDESFYREAYERFRHGPQGDFPEANYLPGLYAHVALGSRGMTTALLSAELLASQIEGEPLPIESSLVDSVHPGRFLMRQMKRGG